MKIHELMTPVVHTVLPHASLYEAAGMLLDHHCGIAPVVDGEGRVLGIVSDRDVSLAAYVRDRPLKEIPVQEVMSKEVVTCTKAEDANVALQRMGENRVHRLIVLDEDDRLHGVISTTDLAAACQAGKIPAYDFIATFATINGLQETPATN